MNITITQDNSRVEVLGSNGASIIEKLYELAIDPNNTLTLEGNISSTAAYGYLVDYLNTNYGPDFIVSATNRYIKFQDDAVLNVLKSSIGDGVGVSETQLSNLTNVTSLGLVNNTNITDFREGCLLTNLNIYIQEGFINGCTNLDVVGIPPYLTNYGSYTTGNCTPSKIVISNWGNWVAASFGNGNYLCEKNDHDLCTLNADNSLTVVKNVTLPQGCDFHNQRAMCGGFYKSTVEEVTLPASVTRLADFLWSKILTINFPQNSGLTKIFEYCFYECTDLTLDLSTLPQSITYIGDSAFWGCANVTGTLNLPNLTDISANAFRNANITSISNLGSITTLSSGTFYGCRNLTSVLLPSTLTTISTEAFNNTAITRLLIPEGVTTIQDSSFLDSSPNISYVELPSTISNINFLFHRMFEAVSASDSVVVVIKATTPPQARYYASWAADSTNVTKCRGIYVPDASVSAYTSITDSDNPFSRSNVIAKIYPISLLLTDSPSAWLIYNRS